MHGDLGDPVGARLAAGARLGLELLQLASVEDRVELPAQRFRGLAVEDLEDGPPRKPDSRLRFHVWTR
jgi:hypothetical protein